MKSTHFSNTKTLKGLCIHDKIYAKCVMAIFDYKRKDIVSLVKIVYQLS